MIDIPFWRSTYDVEIPKIIYGTAWKKERTSALVEQAVLLGFPGIDTAAQPKHYDEAGVGAGLAALTKKGIQRSKIYLQSKFTPANGQDPARMPYDPNTSLSQQVAESFENSLTNLGTDYLDCLVLHSPLATERESMEVWQAMEAIFDTGRVRQLGISNCYRLAMLEGLYGRARIKPAVIQNRFYAATGFDHEIRAYCAQNRIYYQSFWTLTANPAILGHPLLERLSSANQRTAAQILFRYLSQIEIIPLTGTTSETHMRQDLAIFEFTLSGQELKALGALFRIKRSPSHG